MSRRALYLLFFTGVAVLFAAALALAQKPKTINIYTDAVLPNGQHLKAGTYQVAVDESAKEVTFMKGKKVVATQGCKVVEVPVKNDCNKTRFAAKGDKQELQELSFGGEHRSILLIQGGM